MVSPESDDRLDERKHHPEGDVATAGRHGDQRGLGGWERQSPSLRAPL